MGEPTFWRKLQDWVIERYAKYRCWRGYHVYFAYGDDAVCHWCGRHFKIQEILDE